MENENTIQYNFSPLYNALHLLGGKDNLKACILIQNALNDFFTDFECTEVIYTENTDKEFFGINIRPLGIDILSMIQTDGYNKKYNRYAVEFDSKLCEQCNEMQLASLLLRDINEINNTNIIEFAISTIDCICANKGIVLNASQVAKSPNLLLFGVEQLIRNHTSIFCKDDFDELVLANDFIRAYDLTESFESAFEIVTRINNPLESQVTSKSLLLNWYLSLYNDIDSNNRYIIVTLRKCLDYTASKLIKRSIINALKDVEILGENQLNRYISITEATKKKGSLFSQIKYNGLRSIEEDLYEYSMRIKNVDTQDEAIIIMRQISSRMEILDDYLMNQEDLSDTERERWQKVFDKYERLREELSKKTVYNKKMYGLFVDYNALQNMSGNSITMNTYY